MDETTTGQNRYVCFQSCSRIFARQDTSVVTMLVMILICIHMYIYREMKDLFGGFSGFQHMERMGPGNNCWTFSKVVDKIATAWPEKPFQF